MTTIDPSRPPKSRPRASTWTFMGVLIATGAVGYLVSKMNGWLAWLLTLGLMAAVVIAAGYNIKKLYFGFLVDERNRYSLSRLQIVLWTLVVLSGYLTAVFVNLNGHAADPLAVAVPKELWVLLGISVTSLLGSPLIVNQKRSGDGGTREAQTEEKAAAGEKSASSRTAARKVASKKVAATRKTAPKQAVVAPAEVVAEVPPAAVPGKGEPELQKVNDGMVAQNAYSRDASWSDLFKGEMTNNESYLDISRVQLFYFTFILVMVYCFQLAHVFAAAVGPEGVVAPVESLPAVSGGMLALLGISHSAYLGGKAVPRNKPAGGGADGA